MNRQLITVNTIEDVLEDYRKGKMVIMVDDQDRENEGDLLVAAESISDDHINFMASKGRGLICLTLTEERCNQLDLPLMVSRNSARFSTNFTVSIEAAEGVTTGISAQDRAVTIQAAVKPDARPEDLVTPGHIFPIKAQAGGVLTRAGHTEAGVDMARLCGFLPASVICEILKDDGSMARLPDLVEFGEKHNLKIGTIADLISYRLKNDPTLEKVSNQSMRLNQGEFQCSIYHDVVEGGTHLALVKGEITRETVTPVRVHVHRGLLDSVLSPATNWSWTLNNALDAISKQSYGVVVILSYNESVDELVSRINLLNNNQRRRPRTLNSGSDAHQSPENLRMLGAGGQILADLGVTRVLALGRQKKAHGLSGFGLEIIDYIESPDQLAQWNKDNDE
jgi:3,4-dihydroxy 2-butanone 4-phosphate synthase/GTP cyclohydrolase II